MPTADCKQSRCSDSGLHTAARTSTAAMRRAAPLRFSCIGLRHGADTRTAGIADSPWEVWGVTTRSSGDCVSAVKSSPDALAAKRSQSLPNLSWRVSCQHHACRRQSQHRHSRCPAVECRCLCHLGWHFSSSKRPPALCRTASRFTWQSACAGAIANRSGGCCPCAQGGRWWPHLLPTHFRTVMRSTPSSSAICVCGTPSP